MAEEGERERWYRISEPLDGAVTAAQEFAIRDYANEQGFPTLRGFHMRLRMMDWDYYDVLRFRYE